jgi:hypothetical protein
MWCSSTGEMVACCGSVELRVDACDGGLEVEEIACCGSVELGFVCMWTADGGVCDSAVGGSEVSDFVAGREGGAV